MPRKRAASSAIHERPPRRSGRISSTKKSAYFEDGDDLGKHEDDEYDHKSGADAEDDEVVEDKVEGADDDHHGEEDDDEDSDAPPRVVVLPLKKLRGLDGVEYEAEKLHKNTLLFLRDLQANNRRAWLKSNDGEYRRALKDWESFVETFTAKIIEADDTIPPLPPKDFIFRVHRDIRFTKDPTPYKPHFSAAWSRTGRKGPYACYYVHVEPGGNCFQVQDIRWHIDEWPEQWRQILNEERFKRTFLAERIELRKMQEQEQKQEPGVAGSSAGRRRRVRVGWLGGFWAADPEVQRRRDEREAAVKAFVEANQFSALKTRPKGYLASHEDIELLKLRSYTVGVPVDDDIFTRDDAQDRLAEIIQALVPFVTFLNRVTLPDSSENEDEDEDEA
ncbi:hypothetical protein ACRALDRAFT_2059232 [Sodiomyces alcalophilus JCM 7366]|uniref:uncharacterized protein n=1 Tax=Sodiomyces alcalophilus JCM 7366 TaxID=591952 RepID=UPI0039B3E6B7